MLTELRTIARHAGTVLVGQLAVMAFGVTDTIVAGRYSEQALAALSVGSAVYISVFVALMGVLQALLPTWAELHGAGSGMKTSAARCGRRCTWARWACWQAAWPCCFPAPLLRWTEVPVALQGDVARYLAVLALALPPALLFRMYSTLNQSLGKPQLVTWLQAAVAAGEDAADDLVRVRRAGPAGAGRRRLRLGHGGGELPVPGLAIWLLRTQPLYQPYAIWRALERPDWRAIGQFAAAGRARPAWP